MLPTDRQTTERQAGRDLHRSIPRICGDGGCWFSGTGGEKLSQTAADASSEKEDIEEFCVCGKEGYADETMQIKSIELSRQGLEHTADMQQREITQKCRLSVGLGAMSGLLILLLLV